MGPLLAAAPALASSLFGAIKGVQALKQSKKIKPEYYAYGDPRLQGAESPYAKQMLGLAQTQLNARNPYAAAQQRGILGSQAGAMANVQRNVTDPSQALAMTAALQANTNQALYQQAEQEQQDYQRRLANLTGAQETMIGEGRMVYQDRLQRYQEQQARKDALQNAGTQAIVGAGQSLTSILAPLSKMPGLGKTSGVSGGTSAILGSGSNAGTYGGGGSFFMPGVGGGYQAKGIGAMVGKIG